MRAYYWSFIAASSPSPVTDSVLVWDGNIFVGKKVAPGSHTTGRFVCDAISAVYDGEFSGGKMCGYGKLIFSDGEVYTGQWGHDGRGAGLGENLFKDGEVLRAVYLNGKANGPSEYVWRDGAVYRGPSVDELRHGVGEERDARDVYLGEFVRDKRHGIGQAVYVKSRGRYIGEWASDQKHGRGRLIYSNGSYCDRVWVKNKMTAKQCDVADLLPQVEHGQCAEDAYTYTTLPIDVKTV